MNNTSNTVYTDKSTVSAFDPAPVEQRAPAMAGSFAGSVVRPTAACSRNSTEAINQAIGTIRQKGIFQRMKGAFTNLVNKGQTNLVNKGQLSKQQRLDRLQKTMIILEQQATLYFTLLRGAKEFPALCQRLAELLTTYENNQDISPAEIISNLKRGGEIFKSGFDNNVFDSSQPITAEVAAKAVAQFRCTLDNLKFKPEATETLHNLYMGIGNLKRALRRNIEDFQNPRCIAFCEDEVISTGKRLQCLIDNSQPVLDHVLSVILDNETYQLLNKAFDTCIQNVLYMQEQRA